MIEESLLIFDGACGTTLQGMAIPSSAWDGVEGCNEYLNLSAPEIITAMHRAFYEAGAQVVESNTFGASRIVLAEYGLEKRVREINLAGIAAARKAAEGLAGKRYVAGSVGPTTKLPSLGHISREELFAATREQIEVLVEGGVDFLLVETAQDLLQLKSALIAAFEVCESAGRRVPIMASITVEGTGTMLVGSDIAAAAVTLEPFGLFSLGLNCATGPADMESHIRYLSENWPGRISCMPNQGLPEVVDGKTFYPLAPEAYARQMRYFVERYGVSVVGGCCGTSPEHIRALAEELAGVVPGSGREAK